MCIIGGQRAIQGSERGGKLPLRTPRSRCTLEGVQATQGHAGLPQLLAELLKASGLFALELLAGVMRHIALVHCLPAPACLVVAVGQVYVRGPEVFPEQGGVALCGPAVRRLEAAVLLRLVGHQAPTAQGYVRSPQLGRDRLHALRLLAAKLAIQIARLLLRHSALPVPASLLAAEGQVPVRLPQVARHLCLNWASILVRDVPAPLL
mmetsp:Transcript_18543/g.38573  ORF Transcript_18543/g.38573 Transcript_18543/m.38573 type:complete len:207 (+) Transcript_18543:30-650(+)